MEKTIKKRIFSSFWQNLKNLKPLVLMQLKDKIDFSFLKSRQKRIFKILYSLMLFIVITALIYLLFVAIINLGLFSFIKTLNFRVYLVLMTVIFALSFISCLVGITRTLYFSTDNSVLLTLPVGSGTIFSSKLIVTFIYEFIKNLTYILPFFFAYGIAMGLPFGYYIWSFLSLIYFTIIVVCLCGMLSIPAMWLTIVFKKHKYLEVLLVAVFVGLFVLGIVKLINLIPQDIDLVRDWGKIYWSIQNFLASFASRTVIIDYLLQLFTGMSYNSFIFMPFSIRNFLTFINCFAVIMVSICLIYILSRPLFLKMASNPFEYKKVIVKGRRKNHKFTPFASASIKNSLIISRSSNLLYSVLAVAILIPISVLLQNRIVAAMDTRILGNYMAITFNVLIILLLALSSSVIMSSVFSREGNSAYLNKVNPVNCWVPLSGKLIFNSVICICSIVVATIVLSSFAEFNFLQGFMLALSLILMFLSHLLWSAELDIMNPQNRIYQTTGSSNKNPNETKSTIMAFAISGIFAFVCFFLMSENINLVFIKLLLIAICFFAFRAYQYFTKIRLYYKEK